MKIIFILLPAYLIGQNLTAQVKPSQKEVRTGQSSKKQMQAEMVSAINELNSQIADLELQIAEAKKSNEDPESIRKMEQELTMLKKQVAMIGGVNKNLSNMSDKTLQQANEEEPLIPKRDVTRINSLPKKILTEAELSLFIKNVHMGVEKIIPADEKKDALEIYNETKAKYKSPYAVSSAASGCWMLGHWEKALFLIGRVCMDDITDADNLNNYAAFLIMTGGEQAALPILEYLNEKYPNNSTIANNIGQAWFGLGDLDNAKKYLNSATVFYPNHSLANNILSKIYQSQGDTTKAIAFLKTSIKGVYDPDKEAALAKLGYKIKYADMPEFNYPMEADPLGIVPFVESIPEDYPTRIGDDGKVNAINSYILGTKVVAKELNDETEILTKKITDRDFRLAKDQEFRIEFLEPHSNSPAHKLALRSRELILAEKTGNSSPLITQLWLPAQNHFADINGVKTVREIWLECQDIWTENVAKPVAEFARAWKASNKGHECSDIDAATNEYLAKVAEIRRKGIQMIKKKVHETSREIDNWVKIALYSVQDDPPKTEDQLDMDLISELDFTIGRKTYRDGELYYIQNMAQNFVEEQARIKSACDRTGNLPGDPNEDELTPLLPPVRLHYPLKCEFKKVFSTPVVVYKFECNVLEQTPNGKLKPKKDPVNRGQGHNSRRGNGNNPQPMQGGRRGPSVFDNNEDFKDVNQGLPPLVPEVKDASQCSIEYDKWGNLVGLNFQLNQEGTALADPGSVESGLDSRWSWNAIASPKKGFMNKLLLK